MHRASPDQLQQTPDGTWQARRDPRENDQRNSVPRPRSVICSPSHIRNIVPVTSVVTVTKRNIIPGSSTRPGCDSTATAMPDPLKQSQSDRAVARVLRNFAPAGFALFLQRLELRAGMGHQLHDDRRRNIRHDPQRKNCEPRQGAAGEHVEHAQNAALLPTEEFGEHLRIDSGNGDVRTDPVHNQSAEQEPKPTFQVAELSRLC
jgi:hypothetical protein